LHLGSSTTGLCPKGWLAAKLALQTNYKNAGALAEVRVAQSNQPYWFAFNLNEVADGIYGLSPGACEQNSIRACA
jgi:hypothetical protein